MEIDYKEQMRILESLGDAAKKTDKANIRIDEYGIKVALIHSVLLLNRIRELEAEVEKLKKKEEIKE